MPRMSEGRLDLTASKQHYTFSSLKAVHITPAAQVSSTLALLAMLTLPVKLYLGIAVDVCSVTFWQQGQVL